MKDTPRAWQIKPGAPRRRVPGEKEGSRETRSLLVALLAHLAPGGTAGAQRLEPDRVIGGLESPAPLVSIGALAVGGDHLFVLDPRGGTVERFRWDGTYLGPLGRRGDGPGEFRWPVRLGWLADTLWVFDRQQQRVSLFSPDGRFLLSYPSVYDPRQHPFVPSGPFAVLPGRRMVVRPEYPDNLAHEAPGSVPVLVTTAAGSEPVTLLTLTVRRSVARIPLTHQGRSAVLVMAEPFSDDPLWAVSPTGSLLVVAFREAHQAQARLDLLAIRPSMGDTVLRTSLPMRAEPLTDGILRQWAASRVARFRPFPSPGEEAEVRRALENGVYRPRFLPLAQSLFVDAEDRIWLQLSSSGGEPSSWLVLDAQGRRLASLQVPSSVRLVEARGGWAWGVSDNEDQGPLIYRFPLPAGLGGRDALPNPPGGVSPLRHRGAAPCPGGSPPPAAENPCADGETISS